MNRRERRAQEAAKRRAGKAFPPGYYETAEAMRVALETWKEHHPMAKPHFALPPKGVAVIGSPGNFGKMCKNQHAKDVVELMEFVGRELGPTYQPTVMMIEAVVEYCGFEIERVSFGELGLTRDGRVN